MCFVSVKSGRYRGPTPFVHTPFVHYHLFICIYVFVMSMWVVTTLTVQFFLLFRDDASRR
jgi:hypothetical protein